MFDLVDPSIVHVQVGIALRLRDGVRMAALGERTHISHTHRCRGMAALGLYIDAYSVCTINGH